ncbi:MAG: repeat-containing protein, partial [Desertimonas sp.]|nr:repeat-containing protein [Desertimonas sp.]
FGEAQIDALALGVGIAAGVGIVKGSVTSAGTVTTRFDGNSTGSAAAQVISSVKATALAEGRAAGGSIVAAIAGGSLQVFVKPVVLTAVNGTLVASGSVDVKSDVRTAARAFYHALSISGFVSGTVGSVSASTDGLSITTAVEGSGLVRSTGGNASILAWHNFDGTNFVTGNKVEAAAKQGAFSLGLAISSVNLTATAKAQVYANVNAGGTLSAPSGTANLMAFNGNYADGQYSRTTGALISAAPDADPTADASGTTQANLLGHVRVFDGTNSTSGASVLIVLAKANDTAFAGINNVGGGLIAIADSNSTAQGTPSVSATLGGASSVIITSGDISARAFSLNDADASTSSTTGGALNLNFFAASASMTPTVSTLVTGGAKISGGVITINATSNEAPQQASDGSFNAATDVSNGSNTITFNLIHNAFTGQLVVYDAQGGTEIAPNLQDRSINVIVGSDPKSLQLGMSFGFDNPATADINEQTVVVDPVTDIIDFGNRSHHFETGDIVVYQPNGTAIGGLPAGTYKVFKIDAFRLKLQSLSVDVTNPPTLIIDGPDVDQIAHRINGSFSNDQYVTYHAPTNVWSFTRSFVDVTDCSPLPCAGSNNDVIYIGRDRTGDGNADDHNLFSGDRVFYSSSDPLGGLSNGVNYYAIRVDSLNIKLATTYCNARGIALGGNGVCNSSPETGVAGDDGLVGSASVVAIGLDPSQSADGVTHTLTHSPNFEIGGLDDGRGYYVVGANGSSFQLSASLGGGPILITDGRGVKHVFRVEGVDITGVGSGQEHRLILDIAPGTGPQRLKGIGGPSGATSPTDGIISASAAGGGGGAINVSTASSDATTTLTISATVGTGATITGGTVNVTTDGHAFTKGVAGNAGGGAISVGDSSSRSKVTVTNTITVESGAAITATGDLTVSASSDLRPSVFASTEQGGLIGGSFGDT